ncbi:hypothetical protein ABZ543_12740 [Streptomyces roseifaciens]
MAAKSEKKNPFADKNDNGVDDKKDGKKLAAAKKKPKKKAGERK